ncbi:DUF4389 domain-containing protein [Candidatus Micrarchaeota archaeon]|nr:DUF4389 domain-containing protein [Candidatus Micrarchaeota archaeon]
MKGVDIKVPFVEKASRMELLVRIVYTFLYMIVAMIAGGIVMCILYPIEWLVILILGKRIDTLNKFIHSYIVWVTQFHAYLYTLTDERPPMIPSF